MNRGRFHRALNVAEKPSVAKSVTYFLSRGNSQKLNSKSEFNPVFQFDYEVGGITYEMIFTSVRGHIMSYDFGNEHRIWQMETIKDLYNATIYKKLSEVHRLW